VLITAAYAKADVKVSHETEKVKGPFSHVATFDWRWPVLVTDAGNLYDVNAITCYLARTGEGNNLLGKGSYEEALVRQWLEYTTSELYLAVISLIYPKLGYLHISPQETKLAETAVHQALDVLEGHLLNHTYFVGDSITVADIILSLTVFDLFVHAMKEEDVRHYVNLTRWFLTLTQQSQFNHFLGSTKFLANDYLKGLVNTVQSRTHSDAPAEEERAEPAHGGELESASESESASETESAGEGGALVASGKPKIKKRRSRQIVASHHSSSENVAVAVHTHPRKLTEKDLLQKGIASTFAPAQPTKALSHRQSSSPKLQRAIQQPR